MSFAASDNVPPAVPPSVTPTLVVNGPSTTASGALIVPSDSDIVLARITTSPAGATPLTVASTAPSLVNEPFAADTPISTELPVTVAPVSTLIPAPVSASCTAPIVA